MPDSRARHKSASSFISTVEPENERCGAVERESERKRERECSDYPCANEDSIPLKAHPTSLSSSPFFATRCLGEEEEEVEREEEEEELVVVLSTI